MLTLSGVAYDVSGMPLVAGLHLAVAPREIVVLVGPSGVGKTTILRLASGLAHAAAGVVTNTFARTTAVFQEPRLLPWADALDNVALALDGSPLSRPQRRELAGRWLGRLGLEKTDLAKHPAQLSGGMQARVAIARAFVTEPDFVVMDEPFAALDLARRRDLQALTRTLCREQGTAALFVTHDLAEAVALADRIVLMGGRPGGVVAEHALARPTTQAGVWTALADLLRQPAFNKVFGCTPDDDPK
jgi:NitT/TauT family transport system ATP-binding protein